jgi:hypothetical protein
MLVCKNPLQQEEALVAGTKQGRQADEAAVRLVNRCASFNCQYVNNTNKAGWPICLLQQLTELTR